MGITGISVLAAHPPFDLVKGVVVDAMHCVFLGVMAKTLIPLWCDTTHRFKPFSIRRKVHMWVHNQRVWVNKFVFSWKNVTRGWLKSGFLTTTADLWRDWKIENFGKVWSLHWRFDIIVYNIYLYTYCSIRPSLVAISLLSSCTTRNTAWALFQPSLSTCGSNAHPV